MFNRLRGFLAGGRVTYPQLAVSQGYVAAPEYMAPSYQDLVGQVAALTELLEEQMLITDAARTVIGALGMLSGDGTPVFSLNEDQPPEAVMILRTAVLDLQGRLDGTEIPAFVLKGVTLQ